MELKSMIPRNSPSVTKEERYTAKLRLLEERMNQRPSVDICEATLTELEKGPNTVDFLGRVKSLERQLDERAMFERQYLFEKIHSARLKKIERNIDTIQEIVATQEEVAKFDRHYKELKQRIYHILRR